jgi:hypothetical protein
MAYLLLQPRRDIPRTERQRTPICRPRRKPELLHCEGERRTAGTRDSRGDVNEHSIRGDWKVHGRQATGLK